MKKYVKVSIFLFFLTFTLVICLVGSCVKEAKKLHPATKKIYKVTLIRDGRPIDSKTAR